MRAVAAIDVKCSGSLSRQFSTEHKRLSGLNRLINLPVCRFVSHLLIPTPKSSILEVVIASISISITMLCFLSWCSQFVRQDFHAPASAFLTFPFWSFLSFFAVSREFLVGSVALLTGCLPSKKARSCPFSSHPRGVGQMWGGPVFFSSRKLQHERQMRKREVGGRIDMTNTYLLYGH